MAEFELNTPVQTNEDNVTVDINPDDPLLPGIHTFELVVIDDDGNASAPAQVQVQITDPGPTAVLTAPQQVNFGESFDLDGSGSSDIPPGQLTRFTWTLVDSQTQ